jgi:hypothetical protein
VSAKHLRRSDDTNVAIAIDDIRPDEELVRFPVNEPVGGRSPDALGTDDLFQFVCDLVQLVSGALRLVRCIGHNPQPVGPGNDGPGSAFRFLVEHREMRIDAADLSRRRLVLR